jgi:predicted nucleic acid-binding protein
LIGLARIDQLALLRSLFPTVWITNVIAGELGGAAQSVGHQPYPGSEALQLALTEGWLVIAPAGTEANDPYRPLNPGVAAGEASAIDLALKQQAAGQQVLLLVDDRCGRAEARRQGLSIIGTAAVLLLAKERALVPACAPLLKALREQGYYLSDALVAAVLNQAHDRHPDGAGSRPGLSDH